MRLIHRLKIKWMFRKRGSWRLRETQRPRQPRSSSTSPLLIPLTITALLGVALGVVALGLLNRSAEATPSTFGCLIPRIVDGDTLRCGSVKVRLAGIDAPEMPGHCRPGRDCTPGDPYASTDNLRRLVRWHRLECRKLDTDIYDRTVARCTADGVDLSCAQVRDGQAVYRYGSISC